MISVGAMMFEGSMIIQVQGTYKDNDGEIQLQVLDLSEEGKQNSYPVRISAKQQASYDFSPGKKLQIEYKYSLKQPKYLKIQNVTYLN